MRGPVALQVGQPAVDPDEPQRIGGNGVVRPVTADDYGDGFLFDDAMADRGEDVGILGEHLAKRCVRRFGVALDVDEQREDRASAIHSPGVLPDALAQRVEVQTLQRPLGFEFRTGVGDEELAIYQEDVGFDAREPVRERIKQRTVVEIVVMGVGARERGGGLLGKGTSGRRQDQQQRRDENSDSLHECVLQGGRSATRIAAGPFYP